MIYSNPWSNVVTIAAAEVHKTCCSNPKKWTTRVPESRVDIVDNVNTHDWGTLGCRKNPHAQKHGRSSLCMLALHSRVIQSIEDPTIEIECLCVSKWEVVQAQNNTSWYGIIMVFPYFLYQCVRLSDSKNPGVSGQTPGWSRKLDLYHDHRRTTILSWTPSHCWWIDNMNR